MKRNKIFIFLGLLLIYSSGNAQVAISDNAAADPDPASVLDLQSTSRGFLIPRMTETQKNAITSPPNGLMIFQTDGSEGFYFNSGTAASPVWKQIADEDMSGGGGGHWTKTDNDIYYNSGDVGIGNSSPQTALDVTGPGWFNDSIAVDGGPASLYINAGSSDEPSIRFAKLGSSVFRLYHRNPDAKLPEPYLMLNSENHEDIFGVTRSGRVRQDYKGSGQAYVLYSDANKSVLFLDNENDGDEVRGINAIISNSAAGASTITVGGWNNGDGTAVYGSNNKYENIGYLGTDIYGVYGSNINSVTNNKFWGAIGTETSAVYGRLGDGPGTQTLSGGEFAIKGIGVETSTQHGLGYTYDQTLGGVLGYNAAGTNYSFGVAGYTETANLERSGGVFGSLYDGSIWGSLAYRAQGGTRYAGYFTSTTFGTGSGKAMNGTFTSIGLGAYGDLMGANIQGQVYGLYTEGTDYSLYANGDVYRSGADVHVQTNDKGENSIMYTLVTTEMVVQTYGVGQMQKGKSSITFDQAFADVVSTDEPIIVTITPIGKSNGVYLDEVDAAGFSVGENNNGRSNVQFSWIAIGKRKGFENKQLPEDVIASDYTEKMQRGLSNDNDPAAASEGLYYQNGRLHNGRVQDPKAGTPAILNAPEVMKPVLKQEVIDENVVDAEKQ